MAGTASRVNRVVLVTGPLAPFSDAYGAELERRGYTPWSVVFELRQVARLSCWLEACGLPVGSLTRARIEQFVGEQRGQSPGRHCSVKGLVTLLDVLCARAVLEPERPAPPSTPTDVLLGAFRDYLLAERSLAASTAASYVGDVRRFLDGLAGDDVALVAATARDVTGAVLREA